MQIFVADILHCRFVFESILIALGVYIIHGESGLMHCSCVRLRACMLPMRYLWNPVQASMLMQGLFTLGIAARAYPCGQVDWALQRI